MIRNLYRTQLVSPGLYLAGGLAVLCAGGLGLSPIGSLAAEDQAEPTKPVVIRVGEKSVGEYHADLKGTPAIYPLYTPAGAAVTRNYPVTEATEHERDDHPHHRSLWFTHGEVNGIDFWGKTKGTGHVQQTSAQVVEEGGTTIRTENDWLGPDDKRVLKDQRRFHFSKEAGDYVIDFSVRLIASDGPVVFGDTKEGSFGVRVAGKMKVDAKLGGVVHNAEGLMNKDAWGKVSPWVDYSGPCGDDGSAGITMMSHPSNDLPDTYWHVRTYGLFAANPFGRRHFGQPAYEGHQLAEGEMLTLHYRVIVHDGTFQKEKTLAHYADYLKQTPGAKFDPQR